MTTRLLRYVVTVAETRSFSDASKRLFVSQPSLSQSVIALEKELGTPLFHRTVPLTLTFAGERFVESAQKILQIEGEMTQEIQDIVDERSEKLNVGATQFRIAQILTRVLPRFQKTHPHARVSLFEANNDRLAEMALSGQTDLTFLNHVPFELQGEGLFHERVLLAVGRDHPLSATIAGGKAYPVVDLERLRDEAFVMMVPGSNLRAHTNRIFSDHSFTPKVALETGSVELAYRFAARNAAVAMVFESAHSLVPARQRVQCFRFPLREYSNTLFLCYDGSHPLSAARRNFIALTKRVLERYVAPSIVPLDP